MIKKLFLCFLFVLPTLTNAAYETGPANSILSVPSAGGRPKFSPTITNTILTTPILNGMSIGKTSVSSSPYHALTTDGVISVSASGGNRTINLPSYANSVGKVFTIEKSDSSSGTVTIVPAGAETIGPNAQIKLTAQGDNITVYANGSFWDILGATHRISVRAADSGISIGSGSDVQLTSFSETYDPGSNFASDTFTAPIAGKYLITGNATAGTTANKGTGILKVYKNGSDFYSLASDYKGHTDNDSVYLIGSTVLNLAVGDTIKFYIFQNTTSTLTASSTISIDFMGY